MLTNLKLKLKSKQNQVITENQLRSLIKEEISNGEYSVIYSETLQQIQVSLLNHKNEFIGIKADKLGNIGNISYLIK
jgi:hypothetical protein